MTYGVTMQQASENLMRAFGVTHRPVFPRLDLWDVVVGIPLDEWITARTTDAVAELIDRRERGEFLPQPLPEIGVDVLDDCGRVVARL